jgi:hypothetical protein
VPEGLPDVCEFVCADLDIVARRSVAAYLRSGTVYVAACGVSICRLCGVANGSTEQTDGEHFVWPEGLAHYVEEHGIQLPDEVVAVALRGRARAVDLESFERALLDTGDVVIDTDWWCSVSDGPTSTRTDDAVTRHLFGCRRSGSPASWHLPATAGIYVDRVPPNSIATLVRLRKLLNASWPFSDLRDLVLTQPFLATDGGNPSVLYVALVSAPELRPYLFYGAGGALAPVWADN